MYYKSMDKNLFEKFGFAQTIIRALDGEGIVTPTEIQEKVIPLAMQGNDVVAKAPTGTGKTLAYVLPAVAAADTAGKDVQTLVLCPTRELAMQIGAVIKKVTAYTEGVRSAVLYGGQDIQRQLFLLRKKPQIVVGTPGRILDHIDRKTLKIKALQTLVLDEGDVMLDMGFIGDIRKIIAVTNTGRQNLLFSATIPAQVQKLSEEMMKEPVTVSAQSDGKDMPVIEQSYVLLKDSQRVQCLCDMVKQAGYDRVIVFCNTKFRAEKLQAAMLSKGINACLLHGDLNQRQRTSTMKDFREGRYNMLISTDVMARGIDVENVQAVFNFDPPSDEDFYVHRIGRTARAKRTGKAITFAEAYQLSYIQAYMRKTGEEIKYIQPHFDESASYTLPKDSSNKRDAMSREEDMKDSKRFFLNVGKRDMLDKPSFTKLVCEKAGVPLHKILDVKIRDTYSFVQVPDTEADKIGKLKGVVLGARVINVELADEKEEASNTKRRKESKKPAEQVKAKGKPSSRAKSKDKHSQPKRADKKSDFSPKGKKGDRFVRNAKGERQNPKPTGKKIKKL